jgi:hypothetical protein
MLDIQALYAIGLFLAVCLLDLAWWLWRRTRR